MKIIHTSDWHIGHLLYSFNREDEFRDFIRQLTKVVVDEQPDVLLISGDIFDSASPTLSARRLWSDSLLAIKEACQSIKIVATAGNHDSGSNLDVTSRLFKEDFIIVGRKPMILRFTGEKNEGLVIAAVPFISENGFRTRLPEEYVTVDNPRKKFYEIVLTEAQKIRQNGDSLVMMAHEAVSDSDFFGQEKYNFNFCDKDSLGLGYDYLALGHIHCPQTLRESGDSSVMRYSGSPLPMGFDENYEHSVTVVEFDVDKSQKIKQVVIKPLRPMLSLPKDKALDESEVINFVEKLKDSGEIGYLRLKVQSDRPLPSLHTRVRNLLADSDLRFCLLKLEMSQDVQCEKHSVKTISVQDLHTIDPLTLALQYYRRKTGLEMEEEMRKTLLNLINDESKDLK